MVALWLLAWGDITIANVKITGARQVFTAAGLAEKPLRSVHFENVAARAEQAGTIEFARDWTMHDVKIRTPSGTAVELKESERVGTAIVEKETNER